MSRRSRRTGLATSAAILIGLTWCAWRAWDVGRSRRVLAESRSDVQAGRPATAARRLAAFLAERPGSDEAAYLLGTCEKAAGRADAADQAWSRIPPGSPLALHAIQRRVELAIDRGRFAQAEQIVGQAMDAPGMDHSALPLFLGPVYWLQGRLAEQEEAVEARWNDLAGRGEGASEKAIELVRLHVELRRSPLPADVVRDGLEKAAKMAPADDRVRLGRANLALREGHHELAGRLLSECLNARPRDEAVWRARLEWAMASGRVEQALEAARNLRAEAVGPAGIDRLAAWLAARRGDRAREHQALEKLAEADPADPSTFDRLAESAIERGDTRRAGEIRRRQSEILSLSARYDRLHRRNQPLRDAAELARLARELGRRFEARGFATIALALDPDRDDLRRDLGPTARPDSPDRGGGTTLAEAVSALLGPPDRPG